MPFQLRPRFQKIAAIKLIAESNHELRLIVLPNVSTERNSINWELIDHILQVKQISTDTQVAISWAKAIWGLSESNQHQHLFHAFPDLDPKVKNAIFEAIEILYGSKNEES